MVKIIKPDYLERLDPSKITNSPCINCLRETEERVYEKDYDNVSAGDKIWYLTYQAEIKALEKVLIEYNPKKIIEIGSGTGRIIRTILDILPKVEIIGTERNKKTYDFVTKRFSGETRVQIKQTDISDYLSNKEQYDIAICLMNTFGNINDPETFNKIVSHSDIFVFSLYNREFDEKRRLMYTARGHKNFRFSQGQYCFQDNWVNGLVSRSYSEDGIKDLVSKSGSELVELKPIELLYFAITKNKFIE